MTNTYPKNGAPNVRPYLFFVVIIKPILKANLKSTAHPVHVAARTQHIQSTLRGRVHTARPVRAARGAVDYNTDSRHHQINTPFGIFRRGFIILAYHAAVYVSR